MSHSDLCALAAKWLRSSKQKRGLACQVAFVEPRISFLSGESPDAIGVRVSGCSDAGSTIVECKVSRSDFLADAKKAHRKMGGGMGRWRYYMCPEGLIAPDELPEKWGLLYVSEKRAVTPIAGPASSPNTWGSAFQDELARFKHEYDAHRETLLLANLLHRLGDAGAMNTRLRKAESAVQRQDREIRSLTGSLNQARVDLWLEKQKRSAA